jgi:pyruvate dehydrogenase E1 component
MTSNNLMHDADEPAGPGPDLATLRAISRRTLWLATAIVDAANRGRRNTSGVKVGGHQASSASMVDIMVALWFHSLTSQDRVSVKPHASPVLHASWRRCPTRSISVYSGPIPVS